MIIQIKVQKSCVASEIYSFVSFNYISKFKLCHQIFIRGGLHVPCAFCGCMATCCTYKVYLGPALNGSSLILYKYHHSTVKLNVALVKSGPPSSLLATKTRPLGSLLAARSGQKVPPQGQFWSPKVGPGGQF